MQRTTRSHAAQCLPNDTEQNKNYKIRRRHSKQAINDIIEFPHFGNTYIVLWRRMANTHTHRCGSIVCMQTFIFNVYSKCWDWSIDWNICSDHIDALLVYPHKVRDAEATKFQLSNISHSTFVDLTNFCQHVISIQLISYLQSPWVVIVLHILIHEIQEINSKLNGRISRFIQNFGTIASVKATWNASWATFNCCLYQPLSSSFCLHFLILYVLTLQTVLDCLSWHPMFHTLVYCPNVYVCKRKLNFGVQKTAAIDCDHGRIRYSATHAGAFSAMKWWTYLGYINCTLHVENRDAIITFR